MQVVFVIALMDEEHDGELDDIVAVVEDPNQVRDYSIRLKDYDPIKYGWARVQIKGYIVTPVRFYPANVGHDPREPKA